MFLAPLYITSTPGQGIVIPAFFDKLIVQLTRAIDLPKNDSIDSLPVIHNTFWRRKKLGRRNIR